MSTYLTKLETHPDLEGSIIRATKIHKVLKAMIRLNSIPKDEEYNFKTRSHELLTKWNTILAADPAPGAGGEKDDDDKPEDKPEPNGVAKEDKKEATDGTVDESENTENKTVAKAEGVKEAEKPAEKAAEKTVEATTDEPKVEKPAEALKPTADPVEATA